MLKALSLSQLVLIDSARIEFGQGYHVFTGETGAGKSALLSALALLAGERADATAIRHGAEKAIVEGEFAIAHLPHVLHLLQESGIEMGDFLEDDTLILGREIAANGKNRCFLNHRPIHLSLLKEIGCHLIETVDQHASQKLLTLDQHRNILDAYGNLQPFVREFQESWTTEKELADQLKELQENSSRRLAEMQRLQEALTEIEETRLQEGEEEELFKEYSHLSHAEEFSGKITDLMASLTHERTGALPLLNRLRAPFNQLPSVEPSFSETTELFTSACVDLQEVAHSLRNLLGRFEPNPERLLVVNERLTELERLKKKYARSIGELIHYKLELDQQLDALEKAEYQEPELTEKVQQQQLLTTEAAKKLSAAREKAAIELSQALTEELQSLNMAQAVCSIQVKPSTRSSFGDDHIEFFLAPNRGEKCVSVRQCASGGELARLMLSLQTLLATRSGVPTLVFDEIDANIGGETASVIGQKLKQIGKNRQVFSVTHFPQVALAADHHIQIAKQEVNGRTFTSIIQLESSQREKELQRMRGECANVH